MSKDFELTLSQLGEDGLELIQSLDPKVLWGLSDVGYCVFNRSID